MTMTFYMLGIVSEEKVKCRMFVVFLGGFVFLEV